MIGTVMKELEESAEAQLPSRIEAVSGIRQATGEISAPLVSSFTVYDWWQVQTGAIKVNFPALALEWLNPSNAGQRNGSRQRESKHRIRATYGVRHNDARYIRRHILYVPEAMLLWLDELPSASRPPHSGLTIVGLDRANDNEIEIAHDVESGEGGFFIWSVAVDFTVRSIDSNLPDRSTPFTS